MVDGMAMRLNEQGTERIFTGDSTKAEIIGHVDEAFQIRAAQIIEAAQNLIQIFVADIAVGFDLHVTRSRRQIDFTGIKSG